MMYSFICMEVYVLFYMYELLFCRPYVFMPFLPPTGGHRRLCVSSWEPVRCDVCSMFRRPREQPISSPQALTRTASNKPRELCGGLPASLTSPL